MKTVRCKFRINELNETKTTVWNDEKKENEQKDVVHLQAGPVYDGSEENKKFFALSPGGGFSLYTVNKEAAEGFAVGKEIYIDITVVE